MVGTLSVVSAVTYILCSAYVVHHYVCMLSARLKVMPVSKYVAMHLCHMCTYGMWLQCGSGYDNNDFVCSCVHKDKICIHMYVRMYFVN